MQNLTTEKARDLYLWVKYGSHTSVFVELVLMSKPLPIHCLDFDASSEIEFVINCRVIAYLCFTFENHKSGGDVLPLEEEE